jgi:hypothetical protein
MDSVKKKKLIASAPAFILELDAVINGHFAY